MPFGDSVKTRESTRIDFGNALNDLQNGTPFFGGTSTGAANLYTISFAETPSAPALGQRFYFIADKRNDGNVTISFNGVTKSLLDYTGLNEIPSGTIIQGDVVEVVYDGTYFRLVGCRNALDGWNLISKTGTYISATSFSISGDLTTVLKKGTRIKLTNSTTKYGVLSINSTYGAGVTTCTLIPNTDYALTNTTVSNVFISRMEMPLGFPAYFNYNATLVGFSVNPSGATYRWTPSGSEHLILDIRQPNNGTSNATTFTISLPVNMHGDMNFGAVSWEGIDNGSNVRPRAIILIGAPSVLTLFSDIAGAGWTASGNKRASVTGLRYRMV